MKEIIVFNSDQSANRFKIESNINNHYGIYTPAYDGFVETWYDQSGNGNDAVQTNINYQPKIVANGSYLGELDFDGVDDALETDNSDLCNITELSLFTVLTPFTGSSEKVAVSAGSVVFNATASGGWTLNFNGQNDTVRILTQQEGSTPQTGAPQSVTASESLVTSILNVPNATTSLNGVEGTTRTNMLEPFRSNAGRRKLRIGCESYFNLQRHYPEPIKEIVLYTSDQSANRPAIEANINNQYSIY